MKINERRNILKKEALEAIKLLIDFIGDENTRDELKNTPDRILASLESLFMGYSINPDEILTSTLEEIKGYDEMILLKNIKFTSYCEHHFMPFKGKCHIAYIPNKKIVGIGKLIDVLQAFANRLQLQERLTVSIADCINRNIEPKGVGVIIEARHSCLSIKGSRCGKGVFRTSKVLGSLYENEVLKREFLDAIGGN